MLENNIEADDFIPANYINCWENIPISFTLLVFSHFRSSEK